MSTEFNPDATDGDGDGIIQEGTPFERPIEDAAISPVEELSVAPEEQADAEPEVVASADLEASIENNVISSETPKRGAKTGSSITSSKNDTIGSAAAEKTDKPTKSANTEEKVAVFSEKNVSWAAVGKLYRGYNFVSKAAAEKWLDRSFVRLATPEEIAREFKN